MDVKQARYDAGWLKLDVDFPEAQSFLRSFRAGEYEITRANKKRSLNANSYAWALMGKIAAKMNVPVEHIYNQQIREIGGKTLSISLKSEAAKDFANAFRQGHIGRKVQLIGEHDGTSDLLLTYGSSDYDTQQMSQLIENIIQDCKALEIETMNEENLKSLLDEWGRKRG